MKEPGRHLALLDQARAALERVQDIGQALEIHDQAEAIRHFCAVRDRSDEAAIKAAEIKLRAARRVGKLLGDPNKRGRGNKLTEPRLIPQQRESEFRKLAAVEADVFEEHIAGKVGSGEQPSQGELLRNMRTGSFPKNLPDWLPLEEVKERHRKHPERFTPRTVKRLLQVVAEAVAELGEAQAKAFGGWLTENKGGASWDHRKVIQKKRELLTGAGEELRSQWLLGDWRDHIETLEDGSVSLLLTDPPYGQAYQSDYRQDRGRDRRHLEIQGDQGGQDHLSEALRGAWSKLATDSHALIFCAASGKLESDVIAAAEMSGFTYRGSLVWDKQSTGMGDPHTTFAPAFEHIIHVVKGSPVLFQRPSSVQSCIRVSADRHPTEKPVDLLRVLIEATTAKGELVADPFGGVGSTRRAAEETGRAFWGCEIEKKYHEAGR